MEEDEARVVVALLWRILALNKEERPTTAQLLGEAWFQTIEVEYRIGSLSSLHRPAEVIK